MFGSNAKLDEYLAHACRRTNDQGWLPTRIDALTIVFHFVFSKGQAELAPGSYRFFRVPFLQLTSLGWMDIKTRHTKHLFPVPPFGPTLRSLSFRGFFWSGHFIEHKNAASFAFESNDDRVGTESARTFFLHNQSLETLSLEAMWLHGSMDGPPGILSNLNSLSLCCSRTRSTLFCVPVLQRFSSLSIFAPGEYNLTRQFKFRATGDGIILTKKYEFYDVAVTCKDSVIYAIPTVELVRFENSEGVELNDDEGFPVVSTFLIDVHTLKIGHGCGRDFYTHFWNNLKEIGLQLETILFEMRRSRFRSCQENSGWELVEQYRGTGEIQV